MARFNDGRRDIWTGGTSKPARVMLTRGKTELLPAMAIVKKLDATVNFGSTRFKVGQCGWEMMTFNGWYRWVFPLVPTACDCAKLDGYFGKLRGFQIEARKVKGEFSGNLSVREVLRAKHHRFRRKWGFQNGDFRNGRYDTLLRVVNIIAGCSAERGNMGNLREIGKLYNLERE